MIKQNSKKILIIDDEKDIRVLGKRVLEKDGGVVESACTAEEGLKLMEKENFNVLLLDLNLPGMSGIDMLKKIKSKGSDTEVIMITGRGTVDDAVEAIKLGAYDFITKPFDIHELRKSVSKAAEKQRLAMKLDVMKAINQIMEDISRLCPVDEILGEILDFSIKLSNADGGSVGIYDENEENIVIKASMGLDSDNNAGKKIKKGERICGWAVANKEAVFLNTAPSEDGRFTNVPEKIGIVSGISIPMIMRDRVIGVLNLKRMKGREKFSRKDFETAYTIARQAAFSVQNSKDYSRLLELDRMKDEFLANVSHELKTPLQSIMSSSEILLQRDRENRLLQVCGRNARRMHKLVVQLLDFSRLQGGETFLKKENIKLRDICAEAVDEIKLSSVKDKIEIHNTIEKSHRVFADKFSLKRVFINLLDNAGKYCGPEGIIEIYSEKKEDMIEVSVKDNGSGIEPEECEKIFDRFYQQCTGVSLTRKHRGLGLGLSMVKKIIEAHRGKVEVESNPAVGSRFYFTVPEFKIEKWKN